jgi:hypothetical protein
VKEKFWGIWGKCDLATEKQLMLAFELHAPATAARSQKAKVFEAAPEPFRRTPSLNPG